MRGMIFVVFAACGGSPKPSGSAPSALPCEVHRADGTFELQLDASFGVYLPCGEHGQSDTRMWFSRSPAGAVTGHLDGCVGTPLTETAATLTDQGATLAATDGKAEWTLSMTPMATCLWTGKLTIGTDPPRDFTAHEIHLPHIN
jgi:hypothetical protein